MDSKEKPIFLLGVGAQKAGTTWLYSYMMENNFVNFGFTKEYHIWDVKFKPKLFGSLRPEITKHENAKEAMRRYMINLDGFYESYFRDLINKDTRITGDITPGYSALDEEHYVVVKDRLESVGFLVKVVFLIRDPAERCWSQLRMNVAGAPHMGHAATDEEFANIFRESFKDQQFEIRTRYERTIEALRGVFRKEDLYVGVYEELFNHGQVADLSNFLTVPINSSYVNNKVNKSREVNLPAELWNDCANYFKETYEYCYKNFPQTSYLWRIQS